MILSTYINRQLLYMTFVSTGFFAVVLVFGRFTKYLSEAAVGKLEGAAIFAIMLFRIPGFLELLIPVGLLIAVFTVFGRMHADSEISVLKAAGVSEFTFYKVLAMPILYSIAMVACLNMYLSPVGAKISNELTEKQKQRNVIGSLTPQRFYTSDNGKTVTYLESIDSDNELLNQLFIVNYERVYEEDDAFERVIMLKSDTGKYKVNEQGERYLTMYDGVRLQFVPGQFGFNQVEFDEYQHLIEDSSKVKIDFEYVHLTIFDLLKRLGDPLAQLEIVSRISLLILIPVMIFISVPLSQMDPRRKQRNKLIPGLLILLIYLSLLLACKANIEKGKISIWIYTVLHLPFIGLALYLNLNDAYRRSRKRSKAKLLTQA